MKNTIDWPNVVLGMLIGALFGLVAFAIADSILAGLVVGVIVFYGVAILLGGIFGNGGPSETN